MGTSERREGYAPIMPIAEPARSRVMRALLAAWLVLAGVAIGQIVPGVVGYAFAAILLACTVLIAGVSILDQSPTRRPRAARETRSAASPYAQLLDAEQFARVLDVELSRARRHEHPLSLLEIGIDEWPALVAQRGRAAAARKQDDLATDVQSLLRDADYVKRQENGRLALLLPETAPDGAAAVALKIHESARARLHVTVRSGMAAFPRDALLGDALVREAEAALDLAALHHVPCASSAGLD